MALSKSQKDDVVTEVADLLKSAKMTVVAKYQGTTVKAIQQLRRDAKTNGTKVKVIKNRLVIKAMATDDVLKSADTSELNGMLLYAFNSEDEVAPAQALHSFAKANPTIEFVGAYDDKGTFMTAEQVKALAVLPGKNQLIAEAIAMLLSPVHDVTNALSGNLHTLLDGVADKASA